MVAELDRVLHGQDGGRLRLKCDGTRAETRFRLSTKRTSPFKSAGERQFSRLLAAEVCASAVVMLDRPCSEVVWSVLATHSIRQFPLHFPSRASPCTITLQLDSATVFVSKTSGSTFLLQTYFIYSKISTVTCTCAFLPPHGAVCQGLFIIEVLLSHSDIQHSLKNTLDERSARRRDFDLTAQQSQQTFIPPVVFEPAIRARERPQTHALGWFYTSAQNAAFETLAVRVGAPPPRK